jgi:hypothetical protein
MLDRKRNPLAHGQRCRIRVLKRDKRSSLAFPFEDPSYSFAGRIHLELNNVSGVVSFREDRRQGASPSQGRGGTPGT